MKNGFVSPEGLLVVKMRRRNEPVPLTTRRLVLRPFTGRDQRLLRELFADPEVTEYLPWGHPYSETETRGRLQQLLDHWHRHCFGTYAIRDKSSRRLVGYAGLEVVENTEFVEVLYAITRKQWGKGLAYEAAAACVKYGFESLGLPLIVGVIAPGNDGSRRVLQKLGMKPAHKMDFYGKGLLYYALSRERYESGL